LATTSIAVLTTAPQRRAATPPATSITPMSARPSAHRAHAELGGPAFTQERPRARPERPSVASTDDAPCGPDDLPLTGIRSRVLLCGALRRARIDPLDDRHRRVVPAAVAHLDDARVAARTILEALRQVDEHLLDQIDLLGGVLRLRHDREALQEAPHLLLRSQAPRPIRHAELIIRGERHVSEPTRPGDDALRHPPQLLRLGVGGLDALVGDQVGGQRAEHGPPMARVAAELPPG